MKKILFLCLFVFFAASFGFSQVFVGGDFSFNRYSEKQSIAGTDLDMSVSTFNVAPIVGYRFGKFDVGGTVILSITNLEFDGLGDPTDSDNFDVTGFGLGVFGHYNFLTMGKLSLLAGADLSYVHFSIKPDSSTGFDDISGNQISIGVFPRVELAVHDRVSVYANIGSLRFTRYWHEDNNVDYSETTFGFSVSDDLSLGFVVFF
jgi:hypothetical protein